MKKRLLLSSLFIVFCQFIFGQVIFEVQNPAIISGYQPSSLGVAQIPDGWAVPDMTNPANSITGQLVVVDDGTAEDSLGCNTLINGAQIMGKIAVVYRGVCNFDNKALNAQNEGAIGVVIVNSNPGEPAFNPAAGASASSVTIPVVMIPYDAGQDLQAYISGGVDVFIGSLPPQPNDLQMQSVYNSVNGGVFNKIKYYSTPIEQIQPWYFYSTYANTGLQTQNNSVVNVDINSGLFNASSTPQSVPSGNTITMDSVLGFYTPPPSIASYDVTYNVSSSSTDDTPYNNTIIETYEITDGLYSRDNGVTNGTGYWLGNGYSSCGNVFEIFSLQTVDSMEFNISNNSIAGTLVEPVIYEYSGGNWIFYDVGNSYTITSQDLINEVVYLDFGSNISPLSPGTYLFSVNTADVGSNTVFIPVSDVPTELGSSLLSDGVSFLSSLITPMVRIKMASCEDDLIAAPQPIVNFNPYENFACVGNCVNEVYLDISNANYIQIFDDNLNLVGSDSMGGFQNYTDTISGTFCLGETYAAVAKSRCDINSPFIQISDTIFFEILNSDITIFVGTSNTSGCGNNDGSATFYGDFLVSSAPDYTINWNGPQSGTVSGSGSGSNIIESFGTNMPAGNYTGEYINDDLGCDPVPFSFEIGNDDSVSIVDSLTVINNTSNCTASDAFVNLIIENPSGNNIDVSWTGPVSNSFTNIPPSSGPLDYINIPGLSNGTYQIVASITGNPTCSSDTITVQVNTNSLSQDVCVVTVDELTSTYNILVWEKPASMQAIDSFFIYREITTNNYQKIGAVDGNDLSEYEDLAANPNSTNYKYKITVLDDCGIEGDYSLFHNSIHLQYLGIGNFQWTPYEIESTSNQVGSYNFYRDDFGTGNFVLLQIIPGGNTTFTDVDYATFPNAVYRVDVNWTNGMVCTSTKANTNTSRSNKKQQITNGTGSVLDLLSESTTVRPVPAVSEVVLQTSAFLNGASIRIVNTLGEVVKVQTIENTSSIINIDNFSSGIYFLTVETPYGYITKKLIKE